MLEVSQDTHTLLSSKRDTLQLLQQLKETGEPVVITINGKAEFIVRDATSYQQLMDLVERLDAIEAIREGFKDAEEGRVVSLDEAMEMVRKKHGLSL